MPLDDGKFGLKKRVGGSRSTFNLHQATGCLSAFHASANLTGHMPLAETANGREEPANIESLHY
jgi:hypothetical protein